MNLEALGITPDELREQLIERAATKLADDDKDGKPNNYGGRPRHEHLLRQLLNEEFTKAVRENITGMVTAFRDAVKADAARITADAHRQAYPGAGPLAVNAA